MATERQIAANRRNARRSTGPRSAAGRKRSSRNSLRHGLAAGVATTAERLNQIERLARKIAGANADVVRLGNARTLARAAFELAQIRRAKVALISRVMAFGAFETPDASETVILQVEQLLRSSGAANRFLRSEPKFHQCQPQSPSARPKGSDVHYLNY